MMAPAMFRGRTGCMLQVLLCHLQRKSVPTRYRYLCRTQQVLDISHAQARSISCSCHQRAAASGPQTPATVHEEIVKREKFIPVSRHSLVRCLMQKKYFMNEGELRKFESFAIALDSAIVNKYHDVWREIKLLFDPINPDKKTAATEAVMHKERLDNEFWLLQKLATVMEKANFHELSKPLVQQSLAGHLSREGIIASVNMDRYDVVRLWALGKETPTLHYPWYKRLRDTVLRVPPPKPMSFYKRVVVAIRLKHDSKLTLKAFKEVPTNSLEYMLPDGLLQMSNTDKAIVTVATSLAGFGVLAKVVAMLAGVDAPWTLVLTVVTGSVAAASWTSFKNRCCKYMVAQSRALYLNNIASNHGLLTLLVDRAEDESFKQALLAYTFLLTSRSPVTMAIDSSNQRAQDLGSIPAETLKDRIERWLHDQTGGQVDFDTDASLKLLTEFGLLSGNPDSFLHVLPLDAAMHNLPHAPQSIIARAKECDIIEGYDQYVYGETEEDYAREAEAQRSYGWF